MTTSGIAGQGRAGYAGQGQAGAVALCVADLHSNLTALRRLERLLAQRAGDFALVLAAGDITVPGHEAYAEAFVATVRRHRLPLLLVHGNNDTAAAVEIFRREGVTTHRRHREVAGYRFAGFGGDGTAQHDLELAEGETLDLELDGAVLLTHVPPRGLRYGPDAAAPPSPAPQPALANAPRAQVCGHVHQTEGVAWLAQTKVVKLRAAMWNRCATLALDTLRTSFFDLGT